MAITPENKSKKPSRSRRLVEPSSEDSRNTSTSSGTAESTSESPNSSDSQETPEKVSVSEKKESSETSPNSSDQETRRSAPDTRTSDSASSPAPSGSPETPKEGKSLPRPNDQEPGDALTPADGKEPETESPTDLVDTSGQPLSSAPSEAESASSGGASSFVPRMVVQSDPNALADFNSVRAQSPNTDTAGTDQTSAPASFAALIQSLSSDPEAVALVDAALDREERKAVAQANVEYMDQKRSKEIEIINRSSSDSVFASPLAHRRATDGL